MRHGIMVNVNQVIDHQVAAVAAAAYGVRTRLAEQSADTASIKAASQGRGRNAPASPAGGNHPRPWSITVRPACSTTSATPRWLTRKRAASPSTSARTRSFRTGSPSPSWTTPGHAAFTAIRSRGARVTDIAVLVVAADDGIMPQTDEAIDHARAADVPIVVAINKMDLPTAQPDVVKRQLSERNLLVEEWGGDVIAVPVSAQTGDGVDDLLENLSVLSEILELKANPDRSAAGVIVEATLDRRRGPSATVLIQAGTLRVGD